MSTDAIKSVETASGEISPNQQPRRTEEFGRINKSLKPMKDNIMEISNATNEVLVPENSGVRVIFPKGYSPVIKYKIKCQVCRT